MSDEMVGRSSAGSEQRTSNSQVAGSSPAVPAKPRAKKGTGVYPHRDAEKRRAYLKEYMRKRRAKS